MANSQQLDILRQGAEVWNAWREQHPDEEVDFSKASLNGLPMIIKANFSNANFSNANLSDSQFGGCNFCNANLSNALLVNTLLGTCDLSNANLRGTDLTKAHGSISKFIQADLTGALLDYTQFTNINLTDANLTNVSMTSSHLQDSNIFFTNLSNVDFTGTRFTNCHFNASILSNTKFGRNNFYGTRFIEQSFQSIHKGEPYAPPFKDVSFQQAQLRGADLSGMNLDGTNFNSADLLGANLQGASLIQANINSSRLNEANLTGANLTEATLRHTGLVKAQLSHANLTGTNLSNANLTEANLTGAILEYAILTKSNLSQSILTSCSVYGLSAWSIEGEPAQQSNLIITPNDEVKITIGDILVAQFIYNLLNRKSLRNVITTLTSKAVLILGRFTPERKRILDVIAEELKRNDLLPIIFDFEGPSSRNTTETIRILAGLSFFVIADITNPKSSPLELQATVPDYQVPYIPILEQGENPFSMFSDLQQYPWVSEILIYESPSQIVDKFQLIIDTALDKSKQIQATKSQGMRSMNFKDYINGDS